MARISERVKQEILDRADIAEIVGEHVQLQRRGNRMIALCPFHKEKTPSFHVNSERNLFHCFGCKASGDVIKFIQMHENLDFVAALEYLARRVGVQIEWEGGEQQERFWDEKIISEALEFYRNSLNRCEDPRIHKLLEKRGLTRELIQLFQIGYADPAWDSLIKHFERKKVEPERLEKMGLARKNKTGKYNDWFRDRLLFPIFSISGQVVGFGGRALGDDNPKYLNSPESGKFNKGRLLYSVHLARKHFGESRTALLAEGYMDVIALYNHGFKNAVGCLGTALTVEQARLLKRYVGKVYIVYDGDEAGKKAALRATEIMRDADLPCRVVQLPSGTDPDDYLSLKGAGEFQALVDQALEGFDYRMETVCSESDLSKVEDRRKVVASLGPWIEQIRSEMLREDCWRRLSDKLRTSVETLKRESSLSTKRKRKTTSGQEDDEVEESPRPVVKTQEQLAKEGLLALLMQDNKYWKLVRDFWFNEAPQDEEPDELSGVIDRVLEIFESEGPIGADPLWRRLDEEGTGKEAIAVLFGEPLPENREKAFREYCRQIRYHRIQKQIRRELGRLKQLDQQPEAIEELKKSNLHQLEKERYSLGDSL